MDIRDRLARGRAVRSLAQRLGVTEVAERLLQAESLVERLVTDRQLDTVLNRVAEAYTNLLFEPPQASTELWDEVNHREAFNDLHPFEWTRRHYLHREVFSLCAGNGARRVLDFGCGAGKYVLALALQGSDCIGVDLSEASILAARREAVELGLSEKLFQCTDGLADLPAAEFDVVIALGSLEHTPRMEPHLGEIVRVLAPGGRLLAATPNLYTTWALQRIETAIRGERWRFGYENSYSPAELGSALERAGLEVERAYATWLSYTVLQAGFFLRNLSIKADPSWTRPYLSLAAAIDRSDLGSPLGFMAVAVAVKP